MLPLDNLEITDIQNKLVIKICSGDTEIGGMLSDEQLWAIKQSIDNHLFYYENQLKNLKTFNRELFRKNKQEKDKTIESQRWELYTKNKELIKELTGLLENRKK